MRRDRNLLNSAGSFSLRYNLPYSFLNLVARRYHHMGDLNDPQIKFRLAFLDFFFKFKDVSLTCRVFKISKPTFYKWSKRYQPNDLSSLKNKSKTPKRKRQPLLSEEKEEELKRFRKQYIFLGKEKLSFFYQKEKGEKLSSWQFQKVIQKYHLYPDKARNDKIRTKKAKNKGKKKLKIININPSLLVSKEKPFFFCLDTIVLYLPWGVKRYILTALDYFHKIGYAKVYKSPSSLSAFDFLLRLNVLVEGRIAAVLSDNGSEWSKYFDEALKKLKILHLFTRVKTPKDNACNERFNRTLQEEFIAQDENFEVYLAQDDLTSANRLLTEWLIFYNFQRPHQSLAYQTPIEYTYYTKGVLTMYPSSTTC